MTVQTSNNNYEIDCSGEKIHLGSATNKFSPNIHIGRWGTESYIELNLIGGGQSAVFNSSILNPDGSITAGNNLFILTYSPVGQKPGLNELGGLDYSITIKALPAINIITFTYNHQKANAYLQPPLTAQEIADGATRPDYVVNSIAFYGDSNQVNNAYKTGKIGHLYRMRVTDNVGNQTWADWGFGGGQSQITLSINQTWLNNAVYPIVIAPVGDTFGYTTAGGSGHQLNADTIYRVSDAVTGAVGTGVSMSAYGKRGASDANLQMAVYDDASPLNLITNASTNSVLVNSTTNQWWVANFGSSPTFTAVSYYLLFNTDSGEAIVNFDNTTPDFYSKAGTFGTWPNPLSGLSDSFLTWRHSIYVTYTPSGGANIVKVNGSAWESIAKIGGSTIDVVAKILGVTK